MTLRMERASNRTKPVAIFPNTVSNNRPDDPVGPGKSIPAVFPDFVHRILELAKMPIFSEYLAQYANLQQDSERSQFNEKIWDEFGVEETVFVLDMAGFSRLSNVRGIVHYLSMIQQMRTTVQPIIEHHNGRIVKFEADNCFARFPDVLDAINAAKTYSLTLDAMNLTVPDDFEIHASFGIDHGEFLLFKENDFWGFPVNVASYLGEDFAESGEILITETAFDRVPSEARVESEAVDCSDTKLDISILRIAQPLKKA